jgi:hypothetical protein
LQGGEARSTLSGYGVLPSSSEMAAIDAFAHEDNFGGFLVSAGAVADASHIKMQCRWSQKAIDW